MSGYFNKLMHSYGPPTSAPEPQTLWIAETDPEPVQAMDNPTLVAPYMAEQKPLDPRQAANSEDIESLASRFTPRSETETNLLVQDRSDDSPPELPMPVHTEHLTEHIIERLPGDTGIDPEDTPLLRDAGPDQVTHIHEAPETHIHMDETHLYETTPVMEEGEFETAPAVTPDAELDVGSPQAGPGVMPRDGLLDDLEAQIAKTFAQMQATEKAPAAPVINPADFEPEGETPLPRAETETLREVTREIVKEVHHHHETHIMPAPKRAPRSAAEASQIGRIRFSSAWDRPGGM